MCAGIGIKTFLISLCIGSCVKLPPCCVIANIVFISIGGLGGSVGICAKFGMHMSENNDIKNHKKNNNIPSSTNVELVENVIVLNENIERE